MAVKIEKKKLTQEEKEIDKHENRYVLENSRYYYDTLNDKDKDLYKDYSYMLYHMEDEIFTIYDDKERSKEVFYYVLYDHPEYYYHDVTSFHFRNDKLTLKSTYTYTKDEKKIMDKKIIQETERINELMPQTNSFDKIKYLYDTIGKEVLYNLDAKENQTIVSSLIYKESVCNGYAKLFQYLLIQNDIPATIVIGTSNKESHAINMIRLDNEDYYFDVTQGDKYKEKQYEIDFIDYAYFGMNDKLLKKYDFIKRDKTLFSKSKASDYHYFTYTNTFFTSYEPQRLKQMMYETLNNKQSSMIIQVQNESISKQIQNGFLDDIYYPLRDAYPHLPEITDITFAYQEFSGTLYILFKQER